MIVHNVTDKRHSWIGSWEVEDTPLAPATLRATDIGRTVIYQDHGRAEAGTVERFSGQFVWARFHQGDTAAACEPASLRFAVRTLDGDPDRV